MERIISVSIDLNKIDKSRIVPGKNGAKYYNITLLCNELKDQYGNDVAVTTGQSKEERAANEKPTYIGNGRTVYTARPKTENSSSNNDDLPF